MRGIIFLVLSFDVVDPLTELCWCGVNFNPVWTAWSQALQDLCPKWKALWASTKGIYLVLLSMSSYNTSSCVCLESVYFIVWNMEYIGIYCSIRNSTNPRFYQVIELIYIKLWHPSCKVQKIFWHVNRDDSWWLYGLGYLLNNLIPQNLCVLSSFELFTDRIIRSLREWSDFFYW